MNIEVTEGDYRRIEEVAGISGTNPEVIVRQAIQLFLTIHLGLS